MASLVDRLRCFADTRPDSEALVFKDLRITYHELLTLSNRVSQFLIENRLQKGDRVALLISNSPEYVAIYYGVLLVGGVVVALNTQAKARDILNWLHHSGSVWFFADINHPELSSIVLEHHAFKTVIVGKGERDDLKCFGKWSQVLEMQDVSPNVRPNSDDIAAIIYTSGTTGRPKGVTLSHSNLMSNIDSILSYLRLTSEDSIVNILPFYYSYGNSVLHTHICSGARLILENSLVYPHKVIQKIIDEQASGFSGVPSTFALLLSRVKLAEYDLSCLRYLTQAGGPMAPALIQRLLEKLPKTELFVMYGQTEATARLTFLPPDKLKTKRGSVGIPISGVEIEIRDKQDNPVPVGETGEICVHGKNIMQGYWKDEKKTATVLKGGWLHTGDLAHLDSEGFIYIDGRSSDMIKTGANRISPKEIEEVIQELPEVQEVAVIGVPDETLGEVIKAFVVVSKDRHLQKKNIFFHCKKNLAVYKIPKQIEFMNDLPKTASGKIKKFELS